MVTLYDCTNLIAWINVFEGLYIFYPPLGKFLFHLIYGLQYALIGTYII
jgi:hypothetical protein